MRILMLMLLGFIVYSCNDQAQQGVSELSEKIVYDKSLDSLEGGGYLDSLSSQMDCDDSIMASNIYIKEVSDSIDNLYKQIVLRLDSIKQPPTRKQYASEFKKALLQSMRNYDTLNNADQAVLFYSYGNATMQGDAAKCYQIFLLRQRLFFLRSVFANAYWNYDFDSFPNGKK